MRERFKQWMKTQRKANGDPYSENTINNYCSALDNSPSKLEIEDQYKKSIFKYTDVNEYQKVKDRILQAPNFDEVNKKAGNESFKYGMIKYQEFLESMSTNHHIGLPAMQQSKNPFQNEIDLLRYKKNIILQGAREQARHTALPPSRSA